MSEPVVSVIVPVYNGEQYIENCLDHLLHQTYHALEVIVVNDGSTDSSGAIAARIAAGDGRVRLLHQENAGVSAARNAALDAMTGEYAVFVDADDDITPDYVGALMAQMENPDIGLAICGYYMASRGEISAAKRYAFEDETISVELALERILRFQKYNPAIWNKIFKTAVIREHGLSFDPSITIGEDMLFLIRYCVHVKRCAVTGEPRYIYYTNPAGAMLERKNGGAFKEKWLSEWRAALLAEQELSAHGFEIAAMEIKKVRVADKLLSVIAQYRYPAGETGEDMLKCLRKNFFRAMREPDYSVQKKASIFLNCISPALAAWLRRIKRSL